MTDNFDASKLITAVEARPVVWDLRIHEYSDRNKRKRAWEEITNLFVEKTATAEEKQEAGKALQKRWKNIRDRYSRELKLLKTLAIGELKAKTAYVHSQQMSFLRDIFEANDASSFQSTDDERSLEALMRDEFGRFPRGAENKKFKRQPNSNKRKAPPKKRPIEPVPDECGRPVSRQNEAKKKKVGDQSDDEDDDFHFLLSLLPMVKNIPQQQKLSSRIEMMQVVNKYAPPTSAHSIV